MGGLSEAPTTIVISLPSPLIQNVSESFSSPGPFITKSVVFLLNVVVSCILVIFITKSYVFLLNIFFPHDTFK